MNMIAHERMPDEAYMIDAFVLGKKLQINFAVSVVEKDRLAMISALGDMVRPAGHNYTGNAYHHP